MRLETFDNADFKYASIFYSSQYPKKNFYSLDYSKQLEYTRSIKEVLNQFVKDIISRQINIIVTGEE